MKRSTKWAGWALAAALAAGIPASALAAPDAWVTAKTKMSLMTTDGVPVTGINVDTVDGRVTLHGKVTSEAEKTRAGETARKIEGVREVRNLLQVVPASQDRAVEASDDQIRDRVAKALKDDPSLSSSSVSVESVNKGVVLLGGSADSYSAHLDAVATAARVPGVRRVATEVKSPDALAVDTTTRDAGRPSAADRAATSAKSTAGDAKEGIGEASRSATRAVSDAWITSETKMRLMADGDTPALDINVDTDDGAVTLFGTVSNESQKKAAEMHVRKVDGVKSVKNEIQVVPASQQKAVEAKDDEVQKAVESAMAKGGPADASIDVEVKNGVVRLTGSVPSEGDRVTAATVARATRGVRAVLSDDLRTKG